MKWIFVVLAVMFLVMLFHKIITTGEFDSILALWTVIMMLQYDVTKLEEKIR